MKFAGVPPARRRCERERRRVARTGRSSRPARAKRSGSPGASGTGVSSTGFRGSSAERKKAEIRAGIAPEALFPQVLLKKTTCRFRHSRQQRLSSGTQAPICTIWQPLTPDSHAFARPGFRSPSTSSSPSSPSSTRPAQWRKTASNPRPEIPPPCPSTREGALRSPYPGPEGHRVGTRQELRLHPSIW
jgi:hypothetical protein